MTAPIANAGVSDAVVAMIYEQLGLKVRRVSVDPDGVKYTVAAPAVTVTVTLDNEIVSRNNAEHVADLLSKLLSDAAKQIRANMRAYLERHDPQCDRLDRVEQAALAVIKQIEGISMLPIAYANFSKLQCAVETLRALVVAKTGAVSR